MCDSQDQAVFGYEAVLYVVSLGATNFNSLDVLSES
jgi:hypothetical protein